MSEFEIAKLRKALQRTRDQLQEEKEDHQHTQNRLVQLQAVPFYIFRNAITITLS